MATTTWDNVYVSVQAKSLVAEKYFEIRVHVEDDDNYATFIVWPNTEPHIPAGSWELRQVVGGISMLLAAGDLDQFDLDVNYMWHVLHYYSGTDIVYQVYQDGNILANVITPRLWVSDVGAISLGVEDGGEVHVNKVRVSDFPMPYDFLGPS